jgi:hypothetical protein
VRVVLGGVDVEVVRLFVLVGGGGVAEGGHSAGAREDGGEAAEAVGSGARGGWWERCRAEDVGQW